MLEIRIMTDSCWREGLLCKTSHFSNENEKAKTPERAPRYPYYHFRCSHSQKSVLFSEQKERNTQRWLITLPKGIFSAQQSQPLASPGIGLFPRASGFVHNTIQKMDKGRVTQTQKRAVREIRCSIYTL